MPLPGGALTADARILRSIRESPADGLRQLLAVYGARVRGALLRAFGIREVRLIDEAIADALSHVWRCADSIVLERSLGGYLLMTARYALLKELRARGAHAALPPDAVVPHAVEPAPNPARKRALISCIARLSPFQRAVMLEDLRHGPRAPEQLARTLGCSVVNVWRARTNAYKRLRHLLSAHRDDLNWRR